MAIKLKKGECLVPHCAKVTCDRDGSNEQRTILYRIASEKENNPKAITLQPNKSLVHASTIGHRNEDGSIARTVQVYQIINDQELDPQSGLTLEEKAACAPFARSMAEHMRPYFDEMHRQQAQGGTNL